MPAFASIIDAVNVHRWVVHFALAFLLVAPLFAVGAAVMRLLDRRTLLISSIALMMVGVVAVHVTFGAGQQARGTAVEATQQAVLEKHAELAQLAKESFTLAALLLALCLLLQRLFHLRVAQVMVFPLGAALFYCLGMLWLISAAYYGELLAHGPGVSN